MEFDDFDFPYPKCLLITISIGVLLEFYILFNS